MYNDYVKQNDSWETKAAKLYEIDKLRSYYTKLASSLKNELVELSGGQNCVGKEYVFHYSTREGSVNYKEIPELKFVNLELYRKDKVVMWKLENVGNKFLDKITD